MNSLAKSSWDKGIFNQNFFAETYLNLCEKDRSAILRVNQCTHQALLDVEQRCISELKCAINFVQKFCTLQAFHKVNASLQTIQSTFTLPIDAPHSLPKISDQFFIALEPLAKLLFGLDSPLKEDLVTYLLNCPGNFNKRKFCALFHFELTPEVLIKTGHIAHVIKNKFGKKIKPEDSSERIQILGLLAAEGHCHLAIKLAESMSNAFDFENFAHAGMALCMSLDGDILEYYREKRARDKAYEEIARNSGLNDAIDIIGKIADDEIRSAMVDKILYRTLDYACEMSQTIALMEIKPWFLPALKKRYRDEDHDGPFGCPFYVVLFKGQRRRVDYGCLRWMLKIVEEGYPEKALDLLCAIDAGLCKHIAKELAIAFVDKGDLARAEWVFKQASAIDQEEIRMYIEKNAKFCRIF